MSTVLVTGAGRGIGRAITDEFIRRGHHVIGTARDAAEKPELALRIPIGDAARALLAARRAAPDDVPFA